MHRCSVRLGRVHDHLHVFDHDGKEEEQDRKWSVLLFVGVNEGFDGVCHGNYCRGPGSQTLDSMAAQCRVGSIRTIFLGDIRPRQLPAVLSDFDDGVIFESAPMWHGMRSTEFVQRRVELIWRQRSQCTAQRS
jgi:hypothetical protein